MTEVLALGLLIVVLAYIFRRNRPRLFGPTGFVREVKPKKGGDVPESAEFSFHCDHTNADLRVRKKIQLAMQVTVTILVLAGGGYIVLSGGYSDDTQKWATGLIGTAVGMWMRE